MGGSRVEIEIILFYVLAMIALAVCQTEHSLLKDRVLAVPESDGKAQALLLIADAGDAVLAPMVGARSGLIVSEVVPGVAVIAVVFPDGSPLSLAEIRPPEPPGHSLAPRFLEARPFGRLRWIGSRVPGHQSIPKNRAQPRSQFLCKSDMRPKKTPGRLRSAPAPMAAENQSTQRPRGTRTKQRAVRYARRW